MCSGGRQTVQSARGGLSILSSMVTVENGFKTADGGPGHPPPGSTLALLLQAYPETIAQGHHSPDVEVVPAQIQRLEPYIDG